GGFGHHFCAVNAFNSSYCWGRNDYGQAANTTLRLTGIGVTPLQGIAFRSLSVGRITSCGVDSAGFGYCWGANQRGEIGNAAVLQSIISANTAPTLVLALTKYRY